MERWTETDAVPRGTGIPRGADIPAYEKIRQRSEAQHVSIPLVAEGGANALERVLKSS